jgi:nitrate/TMAO reductase-like tetraheme cytochrome c subunit
MSRLGNIWRWVANNIVALVVGAGGVLVLIVLVFGGEAALSSTDFCVSCHSMSYPAKELKRSRHYRSLGVNPECKDCHIPPGLSNFHLALMTHLVDGARELVLEFTEDYSTRKAFNKRRQEMAHHARMNLKRWDSVTCRNCHKNPQPVSKSAKAAHEKMETAGATCIDCHQNLVHFPVDETDLDASLKTGEMVVREEEF